MASNADAFADDPGGLTHAEAARLALQIAQERYQPILEIYTRAHAQQALESKRRWDAYCPRAYESPTDMTRNTSVPRPTSPRLLDAVAFDENSVRPSFMELFRRAVLDVERIRSGRLMRTLSEKARAALEAETG